ncbi:hypothetical protein Tco_0199017 [Tanacetum coccineum]
MRLLLSLSSCDLCLCLRCRLVPSCFVIFDLEPLSLCLCSLSVHEQIVVMNPTSVDEASPSPSFINSNSCRDVAVLSAGGTTFGTSFELDGSLLGKLLNPRYAGPSRWLKGWSVAYINAVLPQVLKRVHITFHVSNLKKCYSDDPLVVPLEGLQVDDKLHFVEEPVEIMDREVKQLRRSRVQLSTVRSVSRRASWFTWECEDQFRKKYPHLFTKTAPSSSAV